MKLKGEEEQSLFMTMVRVGRGLSRTRYFRTVLYILSCGCTLVIINICFGLDLMNKDVIFRGADSFLPLPPFFQQSSEESEMEKKYNERMASFRRIFEQHAKFKKNALNTGSQACKHPKLDLKHDTNRHAYFKLPPLNCSGKKLFYIEGGGVVKLNRTVLGDQQLQKCVYMGIERVTDDYVTYTQGLEKTEEPFDLILQHDFIRIQCFLKGKEEPKQEDLEQNISNRRLLQVEPNKDLKFFSNATFHNMSHLNNLSYNFYNHSNLNISQNVNNSIFNISHLNYSIIYQNKTTNHSDGEKRDQENQPQKVDPVQKEGEEDDEDPVAQAHGWRGSYEDYEEHWGGLEFNDNAYGVESSDADFDQFLVQVQPKSSVFERISQIKPDRFSTKMNVLILGLDSLSQLSYQRKLPKTMKYLHELDSVILNGYNIVGDATTAALIPILTGKSEVELPEVRKSELESEMVDVYPLIWKQFEKQGYTTLFAEDEPSIGVFNLRLTGFENQPTDHYMRPFWLAIWESVLRSDSEKFCTGKTPHHQFFLQYVKDYFIKYSNVSKFIFAFQTELGHWDNNPVQYIDDDLTDFLHFLNVKGFLENTLLVLMADHGARYSKVRNTVQGKLEERLPMMSFRFPSWFKDKFPDAIRNLKLNAERLTTPFDVHETLLSVLYNRLDSPVDHNSRAKNILQEIPLNRTCKSAGIDVHWCACLVQVYVDVTDKFVQNSALHIVSYINAKTEKVRNFCLKLKLHKIVAAVMVIPNEKVLRYKSSKDDDQREANFTRDINMDTGHYQITLETSPNMGIYEATVEVDFRNETYKYNITADISRIDRYGDQPKCVQEKFPNLRKYCFCDANNQTKLVYEGQKLKKLQKERLLEQMDEIKGSL